MGLVGGLAGKVAKEHQLRYMPAGINHITFFRGGNYAHMYFADGFNFIQGGGAAGAQ